MSQKGHSTGMAGEFHVMALLFRLGHEPALTLGNAKSIDILTHSPTGKYYEVSVKAMRGGGKWGIGNLDYSKKHNLVFVLLHYKKFDEITELPDVWVIPAIQAEGIKRPWHNQYGLFIYTDCAHLLEPYKNAWEHLA
jgi:hypothetical protein